MSNVDLTNLRKEIAYARKRAKDKEEELAKIPEDCPSELRERIIRHLESKADRS